jgi:hypothetical protein
MLWESFLSGPTPGRERTRHLRQGTTNAAIKPLAVAEAPPVCGSSRFAAAGEDEIMKKRIGVRSFSQRKTDLTPIAALTPIAVLI